jgi:hypothetical protein
VLPNPQYLLKAHLDFLMMTGLLFVFFLLFGQLRLAPPSVIVATMSLGSVTNPAGFVALAIRPDLPQRPVTPFGALMALSFTVSRWIRRRRVVRGARHGSSGPRVVAFRPPLAFIRARRVPDL